MVACIFSFQSRTRTPSASLTPDTFPGHTTCTSSRKALKRCQYVESDSVRHTQRTEIPGFVHIFPRMGHIADIVAMPFVLAPIVVRPGATSSFLLLVAMPFVPSSVL